MAASIFPAYPPSLTPTQSNYLLSNIKDWSILHGLAVRPSQKFVPKELDPSGSLAVTAPVTLFPSLFPQACFEEARAIQTSYNELYAAIARDENWLKEIAEEYACSSICIMPCTRIAFTEILSPEFNYYYQNCKLNVSCYIYLFCNPPMPWPLSNVSIADFSR